MKEKLKQRIKELSERIEKLTEIQKRHEEEKYFLKQLLIEDLADINLSKLDLEQLRGLGGNLDLSGLIKKDISGLDLGAIESDLGNNVLKWHRESNCFVSGGANGIVYRAYRDHAELGGVFNTVDADSFGHAVMICQDHYNKKMSETE